MPAATRINDTETGVCNLGLSGDPQTRNGTNSTGSSDVFINGVAAHRVDDTGPCNCPHSGTFKSSSGSLTVLINGKAATRIGDTTTCEKCNQSGSHVSGSSNVFIG